ncbi:effector-associated constant component EACC1 [Streptomyces sp. NPDC003631]
MGIFIRSGSTDDLMSLHGWLNEQRELRGRCELLRSQPGPGEMGAGLEALHVLLDGTGPALVTAVSGWLVGRRRSRTIIEVSTADGRTVSVSADRPEEAREQIRALLEETRSP